MVSFFHKTLNILLIMSVTFGYVFSFSVVKTALILLELLLVVVGL